jgi:hypothetical protein
MQSLSVAVVQEAHKQLVAAVGEALVVILLDGLMFQIL